ADQLRAILVSSDEYWQTRGGATVATFLRALYRDVLDREIDPSGEQTYGNLLRQNVSRFQVASFVITSDEGRQREVRGLYQQYLHRPADLSGLNAPATALRTRPPPEQVIALLVGSTENFQRLTQPVPPPPPLPNPPATPATPAVPTFDLD